MCNIYNAHTVSFLMPADQPIRPTSKSLHHWQFYNIRHMHLIVPGPGSRWATMAYALLITLGFGIRSSR